MKPTKKSTKVTKQNTFVLLCTSCEKNLPFDSNVNGEHICDNCDEVHIINYSGELKSTGFKKQANKDSYKNITSYEIACKYERIQPLSIEDFQIGIFKSISKNDQEYHFTHHQLITIIDAINGDNKLSWKNVQQKKWSPYYDIQAGFVFVVSNYYCTITNSTLGSRLCLYSEEASNFFGKQFLPLIKKYYGC